LFVCDSVLAMLLNRSVSSAAAEKKRPERGFYFLPRSFFSRGFSRAGQQARGRTQVPCHLPQPPPQSNHTSRALLCISHTVAQELHGISPPFYFKRANTKAYTAGKIQLCLFLPFFFF